MRLLERRMSNAQTLWVPNGEYYTVFYKEKKVAHHLKSMDEVHEFVCAEIEAGRNLLNEWRVVQTKNIALDGYVTPFGKVDEGDEIPMLR